MRTLAILVFLSVLTFACKPAKQLQNIQQPLAKVDSTPVVVVAENKKTDTTSSGKEVFEKIIKNNIDFTTFNARVRVQYQTKESSDDATAYVRLRKDSAIWLSLRGPLGIEGFRVLITRDSVKIMNLLKKNVQFRSINYLQETTGIPLDFATLQDLVVGNPIFISSNIVSHQVNSQNEIVVLMAGRIFKNLLTLNNTDYKILHSRLDDINASRNRTCDITFSNYETNGGLKFSTSRKMSIAEQSKLDINLDFKTYSFNQPVTFPFNIQKNYKRL